ncbi:MAG: hypothetical protein M3R72_03005 [Bacteroidota bacterium]|nr:hypothetical protein [Bacteroidota bacterium]
MLKKYFSKITLFTVLAFVSLIFFVMLLISRQPEEIKSGLLFNLMIASALFLGVDVLLKNILKLKTLWLWLIQILLLLAAIYVWIVSE